MVLFITSLISIKLCCEKCVLITYVNSEGPDQTHFFQSDQGLVCLSVYSIVNPRYNDSIS